MMPYKKKIYILLSIIAVLALAYTASLVFDPQIAGSRSASYVWLDSGAVGRVSKITISGQGERLELEKTGNRWFVSRNGRDYPARQTRVDDFLSALASRASYPVRSSGAASHTRLGLDEEAASRVTLFTDNGVILDLLFGYEDSSGREIYLRKYGQNEARSGDRRIASYTTGPAAGWYNLKLFPESEDGGIDIDAVQRLSVYGPQGEPQLFSRRNKEWAVSGIFVADPDQNGIDSYIRAILNTEGEDFEDSLSADDPDLNHSRIVLELGNGSVRTVRLTGPDEQGRRFAHVSDTGYVYSLASWAAGRLFRTAEEFER